MRRPWLARGAPSRRGDTPWRWRRRTRAPHLVWQLDPASLRLLPYAKPSHRHGGSSPAARSGPLATAALLAAPGRRGDAPWRWLPRVVVEGLEWQPSVVVAAANEVSRVARSALFATPVTSPALRSGGGLLGVMLSAPPEPPTDRSEEPLGCPGVANQAQAPSPAGPAPRLAPGSSVTPAPALRQAEPSPRREQAQRLVAAR